MNNVKIIVGATSVALVSLAGVAANAQSALVTPTDVPGVGIVAAPPAGFDPVTASEAERAMYAVPPAPDPAVAPKAYAQWLRAMAAFGNREPTTVKQSNMGSGPMKGWAPSQISGGIQQGTSWNWSGTAFAGIDFAKVEAIEGEFVVPVAHQAFGACTGGWDYLLQWVGIDGFSNSDVLQAGTIVEAYCSGGSNSSYYSAFIEWAPNGWTAVSSPAINPGDLVYVEVWNTTSTQGYAYFTDYSTNVSASYSITAPGGTTLAGESVEWIMERPTVNNLPPPEAYATLTNYIESAWPFGVAWDYTAAKPTYHYQGETTQRLPLQWIEMQDNNRNGISWPTIENFDYLDFQDFGTACNGSASATPPC